MQLCPKSLPDSSNWWDAVDGVSLDWACFSHFCFNDEADKSRSLFAQISKLCAEIKRHKGCQLFSLKNTSRLNQFINYCLGHNLCGHFPELSLRCRKVLFYIATHSSLNWFTVKPSFKSMQIRLSIFSKIRQRKCKRKIIVIRDAYIRLTKVECDWIERTCIWYYVKKHKYT